MKKQIVIFADGTGQEGGGGSFGDDGSNVSKLNFMALQRSPAQITCYEPGLGAVRNKLAGIAGGAGISGSVMRCYNFIADNLLVGDHIQLFGFSRGAATVMSLANFIELFGLLPNRPGLREKAYKIYRMRNKRRRQFEAVRFAARRHTHWYPITFIGLFDTVSALGVPGRIMNRILDVFVPHSYHEIHRIPPCVRRVYHALSIDDERLWFHPDTWPDDNRVTRVWFCGCHTDVGGGFKASGLSDITLEWMLHRALEHGFLSYGGHKVVTRPDPNGTLHDSRDGLPNRLYPKKVRSWDNIAHGRPKVHASVIEREMNKQNMPGEYAPWILKEDYEIVSWDPKDGHT